MLPLETPSLFGEYLYGLPKQIMEEQQDKGWFSQEIDVAKDKHDYKTRLSIDQFELINTTLLSFVEIEQDVGKIWTIIASWFPHETINGACKQIAAMEESVHAFFYQKMNDELNILPEDVEHSKKTITTLANKLQMLSTVMKQAETAKTVEERSLVLFTLSMVEQVLLFSNFAMLKSFKANGNSYILNTLTGVDFVVQDEQMHGILASYLFNTYLDEYKIDTGINLRLDIEYNKKLEHIVNEIIEHEDAISNHVFRNTQTINDITAKELQLFIRDRADFVRSELKFKPIYNIKPKENTIAKWFYQGTKSLKLHDFFVAGTAQYRRNWSFDKLSVLPHIGATYADQ